MSYVDHTAAQRYYSKAAFFQLLCNGPHVGALQSDVGVAAASGECQRCGIAFTHAHCTALARSSAAQRPGRIVRHLQRPASVDALPESSAYRTGDDRSDAAALDRRLGERRLRHVDRADAGRFRDARALRMHRAGGCLLESWLLAWSMPIASSPRTNLRRPCDEVVLGGRNGCRRSCGMMARWGARGNQPSAARSRSAGGREQHES